MTTVHVVIDVIDIQDTPPIFLNVPMSLFVYENTPAVSGKCTAGGRANWPLSQPVGGQRAGAPGRIGPT